MPGGSPPTRICAGGRWRGPTPDRAQPRRSPGTWETAACSTTPSLALPWPTPIRTSATTPCWSRRSAAAASWPPPASEGLFLCGPVATLWALPLCQQGIDLGQVAVVELPIGGGDIGPDLLRGGGPRDDRGDRAVRVDPGDGQLHHAPAPALGELGQTLDHREGVVGQR